MLNPVVTTHESTLVAVDDFPVGTYYKVTGDKWCARLNNGTMRILDDLDAVFTFLGANFPVSRKRI